MSILNIFVSFAFLLHLPFLLLPLLLPFPVSSFFLIHIGFCVFFFSSRFSLRLLCLSSLFCVPFLLFPVSPLMSLCLFSSQLTSLLSFSFILASVSWFSSLFSLRLLSLSLVFILFSVAFISNIFSFFLLAFSPLIFRLQFLSVLYVFVEEKT